MNKGKRISLKTYYLILEMANYWANLNEIKGELVVIKQIILYFSWFTGWRLVRRSRILDFLWTAFCWFLIFLCLNLSNDFYLTKVVVKLFGGDKIMQMVLHLQGWFTKWFFYRTPFSVFCLTLPLSKTSIKILS